MNKNTVVTLGLVKEPLRCWKSNGIELENLALRQQLSIFKRKQKRPQLTAMDRWFWIGASQLWKDWCRAVVVVHPDTVVRWQRERFRRYCTSRRAGRPSIRNDICESIRTMAVANAGWREPRIHGELQKLGIEVSERTVSRILRAARRPPSQTWKTLLHNHLSEIGAIDFFTVSTIRLRVLYVFLVLEHGRRQVLHFGVTEHPTAEWAGEQVIEAFADATPSPISSATATRSTATSFVVVSNRWG